MIKLYFTEGNTFLYNVDDWITLRKTHRIIGEIVGSSSHIPSLPLKISPEEALLLLKKNVVEIKDLPDPRKVMEVNNIETQILEHQINDYKKTRRIQLENVLDMIIKQRRKMNDYRSRDDILNEELEKTPPVTKDNMIWPIFLTPNDYISTKVINCHDIELHSTLLKSKTFEDLHYKGYFITDGAKFGGDFLVYFGDPICHHAIFIVKCIESEQSISPMEIVAFGRLGTSVKKRAVLASVVNEEVCYLTINWIDA